MWKCFHDTQHSYPYILLHIVIIGIGYFDGALPYWMDIGWGYVSCLKYQRSRNSHGRIVDIVSCGIGVFTSAATSRRMWLAELASVGLRCDPYVPTSNQRSWEDIFSFVIQFLLRIFIHLAYCSPETPHECSILRSSCTVDTFTSIHNMDMI